jgi:hypothetical protein
MLFKCLAYHWMDLNQFLFLNIVQEVMSSNFFSFLSLFFCSFVSLFICLLERNNENIVIWNENANIYKILYPFLFVYIYDRKFGQTIDWSKCDVNKWA